MKTKLLRTIVLIMICLTLCGCSAPKANIEMDIHQVWSDIESQIEMPGMMALDQETLSMLYVDFPMDKVAKFEVHIPMMNVHASEVALFEAVDEAAAADIKTAVEARKTALEEQWSMYLPDQYELVKQSKVEVRGKYVIFIIGDFTDQAYAIIDEAANA